MNIHHLQLFYYVARHGGVCPAVRHIPYGIQQPSVSAQLRKLEDNLGVTLFQRRPFELTAAGMRLYSFLKPFFDGLETLQAEFHGIPQLVRLGGAPLILRDYMPPMIKRVRRSFPHLRFSLMEGAQAQIEEWFDNRQIDLAVMQIHHTRPLGCRVQSLCKLPIVLLVNQHSSIQSVDDLYKIGGPDEALIGPWPELASGHSLPEMLGCTVERSGIIEVNSIELIEHYVLEGLGVGISIALPGKDFPLGLRVVPLPGEPCVEVGAIWRDALHPAAETLLHELRAEAQLLQRALAS